MTESRVTEEKKHISVGIVRLILPFLFCLLTVVVIVNSKIVASSVMSSLELCVRSIIPSIFPCMVLSRLIVGFGGGEVFAKPFGGIVEWVFGLSRAVAAPMFLGALCGFPIGASVADRLYRQGELTLDELEIIVGFISLPSPAFVINAVGVGMLGNRTQGIILYLLIASISFFIGIFVCRLRRKCTCSTPSVRVASKALSVSEITVDAVGGSAIAMLGVCAYMVFFSTLSAVVQELFSLSPVASAIIGGLFEFSGGCYTVSSLSKSFSLCALILGWSGIGVHFQVMSVCSKEVSYKKFYLTVFLRALLCFAATTVISYFFDI